MDHRLFVVGYPSPYGGADTELWHTLRLWRRAGWDVTLIPTWQADAAQLARVDAIGAKTVSVGESHDLRRVPGLPNSIVVVSFCNGEFIKHASQFRMLGCRAVWLNCMTWMFPDEVAFCERHGPFAAYVFQSAFQREELGRQYKAMGVPRKQFHIIHGAFELGDFPFMPLTHRRGEPFVLGRIARDDPDKWSERLWSIYGGVPYANKRARVMAWSDRVAAKCGPAPDWAQTLAANQEPAGEFVPSLHCLLPVNGGARENWPRAGLEAMALGVPIVAEKAWGWLEMVDHGQTGFLGADDAELAHYAGLLAHDEELRLHLALNARQRLKQLADPDTLIEQWAAVFAAAR